MKASVIIASRNRATYLEMTMQSLLRQTMKTEDFEVVICDHGSTDGTQDVIDKHRNQLNIQVVYMDYKREDAAGPKNACIHSASNDIIVGIDAGVICHGEFLEHHVAMHDGVRQCYVCGPVFGWQEETLDSFWRAISPDSIPSVNVLRARCDDQRTDHLASMEETPWILFWGCNFSVLKSDLTECGAFDEHFNGWGWDDLELAYRLHKKGLRLVFNGQAWCVHYPHARRSLENRLEEAQKNWIYTCQKHATPELELWNICSYYNYGRAYKLLREMLRRIEQDVPPVRSERIRESARGGKRILLYGYDSRSGGSMTDAVILDPFTRPVRDNVAVLHSFGIRTSIVDGSYDAVFVSNYWAHFMMRIDQEHDTVSHYIIQEVMRVGKDIYFPDIAQLDAACRDWLQEEVRKACCGTDGRVHINE